MELSLKDKYRWRGGFIVARREYENGKLKTLELIVGRRFLTIQISYYSEIYPGKRTARVFYLGPAKRGRLHRRQIQLTPHPLKACGTFSTERYSYKPKFTDGIIEKFMKFEKRAIKERNGNNGDKN